jgi:hypothetical protein
MPISLGPHPKLDFPFLKNSFNAGHRVVGIFVFLPTLDLPATGGRELLHPWLDKRPNPSTPLPNDPHNVLAPNLL